MWLTSTSPRRLRYTIYADGRVYVDELPTDTTDSDYFTIGGNCASNVPVPELEFDPPELPPWERAFHFVEPKSKLPRATPRDSRGRVWACRPRHGLAGK